MKQEKKIIIKSGDMEYLKYVVVTGDDDISIEMGYEEKNIWLTQKILSILYDVLLTTINEHINTIYSDNELSEGATIRKFRIV